MATATTIGDIDLTEVNSLQDAHSFAVVDGELLVTDGRRTDRDGGHRTDPVDFTRPITMQGDVASLPVKGGYGVIIDEGHALLYAVTFGLEIETREHRYLVERVIGS